MRHESLFDYIGGELAERIRSQKEATALRDTVEEVNVSQNRIAVERTKLHQQQHNQLVQLKSKLDDNRQAITMLIEAYETEARRNRIRTRNALVVAIAIAVIGLLGLFL